MLGGAVMGGEWGSIHALVLTIYNWTDRLYKQIVLSTPLKTGNPRGACDSVLKPAGSYRRGWLFAPYSPVAAWGGRTAVLEGAVKGGGGTYIYIYSYINTYIYKYKYIYKYTYI